ncbi:MAG: alpha/beta hydrolase-fold protein [Pseudomonadota bacterium]
MIRLLMSSVASIVLLASCGGSEPESGEDAVEAMAETTIDGPASEGSLLRLGLMDSEHVVPREVQVWLPPGYENSGERYPVLYMHDGQNLFEGGRSYTGDEWTVDETMTRLMAEGTIRPAIVVATDNTGETRWSEYAPQKVVERWPEDRREEMKEAIREMLDGMENVDPDAMYLQGDAYLRFMVDELKPRIDAEYRTLTGPEDTMVAGSSMGGLISLYALAEYPDVFGAAACVSIHWPIGDPERDDAMTSIPAMQDYLAASALDPTRQRIWFDRGTDTLDAFYGPYAHQMAGWFAAQYPEAGENITFRTYTGTEHNEAAWAARLADPLTFLLGTEGAEQ